MTLVTNQDEARKLHRDKAALEKELTRLQGELEYQMTRVARFQDLVTPLAQFVVAKDAELRDSGHPIPPDNLAVLAAYGEDDVIMVTVGQLRALAREAGLQ